VSKASAQSPSAVASAEDHWLNGLGAGQTRPARSNRSSVAAWRGIHLRDLPRRLGLIPVRRWLSLLQVLLLLDMSLFQLLGLLLVPLLHLLISRFIGLLLRHPVVVLLLFLLESLVLLLLLRVQLFLLLLVFLIESRVSRVLRGRAWMGCEILCVKRSWGTGNAGPWSRN